MKNLIVKFILFSLILTATFLAQNASAIDTAKYNKVLWTADDQNDWYEWWYFKVVDPVTKKAFYFCYGMVNPWDQLSTKIGSKTFVSAGSFSHKSIIEEKWSSGYFRSNNFAASMANTIVEIGSNNRISPNAFQGDIQNEKGQRVRWHFETEKQWEYNAMGWTLFFPEISNIYWFPIQASLKMSGWLEFNGERIEFNQAPGYQDRNWGRTFPKWWAWIVSNNFKNSPGTVLASGGGQPKVMGLTDRFQGYTIGVLHQGEEFAFKFPNGDPIKINIKFGTWQVEAVNKNNQKVVLEAYAPKEKFMVLPFTTPQGEIYKDYEALNGYARMKLFKRKNIFSEWSLVADLETDEAGIEYGSYQDFRLQNIFETEFQLQ